MILAAALLGAASLIASGVLFAHQRWLTWLAVAGALWEAQWLLVTLLDRTVGHGFSSLTNFTIGSFLLLASWLLFLRRFRPPRFALQRELPVLLVTAAVLLAAWAVVSVNGFQDGDFVTHGFYNGDTMTFISLVQRAQLTRDLTLTNPFAAGGALEYPTLLHAAVASLFSGYGLGMAWLHLLPLITFTQIILTIPLFFLLWDIVWPEPNSGWQAWLGVPSRAVIYAAQAAIVVYLLGLAWDGYIYPQSHFFLTTLFLLLAALLLRAWNESGNRELLYLLPAAVLTITLMLSNAVTGTAATACTVVYLLLRAFTRSRPAPARAGWLGAAAMLILLFLLVPPGDSSFGQPGFSYTAAGSFMLLAPMAVALITAVWLSEERHSFISAAVALLSVMSFFTFVFSTREIVVENAARFIYYAALIGFPLLLSPVIRLTYFLRRQLLFTTATTAQQATLWASTGVLALMALLPPLASAASAHDHLMFQDRQIVSAEYQEALAWVRENTPVDAVIAASPYAPWAVPQFTGRALLRIDHWLSLRDDLFETSVSAWQGEGAAQERIVHGADFLLLTYDEQSSWTVREYTKVFGNADVSIYQL